MSDGETGAGASTADGAEAADALFPLPAGAGRAARDGSRRRRDRIGGKADSDLLTEPPISPSFRKVGQRGAPTQI